MAEFPKQIKRSRVCEETQGRGEGNPSPSLAKKVELPIAHGIRLTFFTVMAEFPKQIKRSRVCEVRAACGFSISDLRHGLFSRHLIDASAMHSVEAVQTNLSENRLISKD